jgi:hypothetical protein
MDDYYDAIISPELTKEEKNIVLQGFAGKLMMMMMLMMLMLLLMMMMMMMRKVVTQQ